MGVWIFQTESKGTEKCKIVASCNYNNVMPVSQLKIVVSNCNYVNSVVIIDKKP